MNKTLFLVLFFAFISVFIKGTGSNLSPTDAALARDFTFKELLYIGSVYKKAGLYTNASNYLRVALAVDPTSASANWELGDIELLFGNFTDGFPKYRHRWSDNQQFMIKLWNHEPLLGKKVLIRYQWDISYCIHFLRYLRTLKQEGAFVVIELPTQYHELFGDNSYIDLIITPGTSYSFDYQIPITYLPELFQTTIETVPNYVPYFTIDHIDNQPLQKILSTNTFHVGVYLEGHYFDQGPNPHYLPISLLEPLADISNTTIYSFSKKPNDEPDPSHGYSYRFSKRHVLTDYSNDYESCTGHSPNNFVYIDQYLQGNEPLLQIGSALHYMDLFITDNTTIGALAGALGISTFIILPVVNDWFWLLDRIDSPWYPTVHLFRQKRFTRWSDVAQELIEATATHVQAVMNIVIQQNS